MTVADTGVLLALVDALHPRHEDAMALLDQGPILLTPPTLTELTRIVRRGAKLVRQDGNAVARRAVALLRAIPGARAAPHPRDDEVADLYLQDGTLSYADAWNLIVSRNAAEPLATFDMALRRAAAKAGIPAAKPHRTPRTPR